MKREMVKCNPKSVTLESFVMSTLRYVLKITLFFLYHAWEVISAYFEGIVIKVKKAEAKRAHKLVPIKKVNDRKRIISIREVKDVMSEYLETNFCDEDELVEEEMGLEEVREAFEVFDVNKDGFIDDVEVQRVLCELGVMEASKSECKGMIQAFDNNGDGKIDLNEFTKILEDSFR